MRRAQMTSMDLVLSFIIIIGVLSFALVIIQNAFNDMIENQKLDKYTLYSNLMNNLDLEPEIDFLNNSHLDLKKLERFGNISQNNMTRWKNLFYNDYSLIGAGDICLFVMNKSHQKIPINATQYAFGMVSNETEYDPSNLKDCQKLIKENQNPCDFYDHGEALTKAALLNNSYVNIYFLFCY